MLRLILRPLLLLTTVLVLCVGAVRVGYGLAYQPAGAFSSVACEKPCIMGIQPFVSTESDLIATLEEQKFSYSIFEEEWMGIRTQGVELVGYGDAFSFFEYQPDSEPLRVGYITNLYSGRCSPEFAIELGTPGEVYVVQGYPVWIFVYYNHGITLMFDSGQRSNDLMPHIRGLWTMAHAMPTPMSRNEAVNLFKHCRG